jgi:hypothetical protein
MGHGDGDELAGESVPHWRPRSEKLMPDSGRIIAITYAPGGRYGSWQSWVGMGAAKSALETLCRYFAVALALRGITVNSISPGWIEDSVLNSLPDPVVQMIRDHHTSGWTPMRRLGTPADIGNAVTLLCIERHRVISTPMELPSYRPLEGCSAGRSNAWTCGAQKLTLKPNVVRGSPCSGHAIARSPMTGPAPR